MLRLRLFLGIVALILLGMGLAALMQMHDLSLRNILFVAALVCLAGWIASLVSSKLILRRSLSETVRHGGIEKDLPLDTISHEIKSPLTGIRMALLLLQEERSGSLTEKQRILVSYASGDCERLLTTLNNLLDLARAESGDDTRLERVPLDVRANVAHVTKLFAGAAITRNIDLRIEGDAQELPEILADSVRLDGVLNNLISNALKHSPEGGVIVIRLTKFDDRHVRVSVIDRGSGVPKGSQDRIFERFYRAPGQEAHGAGLGLYLCRKIMRDHEGRIGLLERTGDSTEFYIDIPVA